MIKTFIKELEQWYGGGVFGESCELYTLTASDDTFMIKLNKAEVFKRWFQQLDDNLVIELFEELGSEKMKQLSDSLETNPVEVEKEIKKSLNKIITDKINYYTECSNRLLK